MKSSGSLRSFSPFFFASAQRRSFAVAALFAAVASGQGIMTTIAGRDYRLPAIGAATTASLGHLASVVADGQGNVYASDPDNAVVVKTAPDGTLTIVAGNGIHGYSGDGGAAVNA